ncbi:TIGR01244 family sulfur transferase [Flavimaricola marinus]|uniref:Beta-lactamase hydrolase-like protein n=1 Tax=Flavimaricola marinus TaxID=1819565 RepID=A0A238LIX8_9RHOB|nr:TIGR01244 family sulfur transferase [Flavimaricola marinus]SMY09578.1 Beta-lactamase hydrolase-like protein [Flavimaricola marinus]
MEIRPITPDYAVSPQIAAEDIPAIAAAGYTTILCNRPDAEVPPGQQADAIRRAAEAAGLGFVINPVTHQGLNDDMVAVQAATIRDSEGPVLAYCASGTRSTIVWALGQASQMSADSIIEAGAKAGYDLSGLRDRLT